MYIYIYMYMLYIYIYVWSSLGSKYNVTKYVFCSKCWRKVLMVIIYDVSLIIFDKNPCNMFSNNS